RRQRTLHEFLQAQGLWFGRGHSDSPLFETERLELCWPLVDGDAQGRCLGPGVVWGQVIDRHRIVGGREPGRKKPHHRDPVFPRRSPVTLGEGGELEVPLLIDLPGWPNFLLAGYFDGMEGHHRTRGSFPTHEHLPGHGVDWNPGLAAGRTAEG